MQWPLPFIVCFNIISTAVQTILSSFYFQKKKKKSLWNTWKSIPEVNSIYCRLSAYIIKPYDMCLCFFFWQIENKFQENTLITMYVRHFGVFIFLWDYGDYIKSSLMQTFIYKKAMCFFQNILSLSYV